MRTLKSSVPVAAFVLAAGVLPGQGVLGTYTMRNPQAQPITLVFEADGVNKVKGTLAGNGASFAIEGLVNGGKAGGVMRSASGAVYFEARRDGEQLRLILVEPGPNGQPNYSTARELVFTPSNQATAPSAPEAAGGASAQDQQLSQLLLSSPWCSFSYSGGSTYNGGSYGTTTQSRVVFSANGLVQRTSGRESTNSGAAGNVWGGGSGAGMARWRVQGGILNVSENSAQWQPVRLEVSRNSNGYPIIKADGVEYMQCR